MSSDRPELFVSVLVPNRGLESVHVHPFTTIQEIINILISYEDLPKSVLGRYAGVNKSGWALQVVRKEKEGRAWEDSDLAEVGDGQCCLSRRAILKLI